MHGGGPLPAPRRGVGRACRICAAAARPASAPATSASTSPRPARPAAPRRRRRRRPRPRPRRPQPHPPAWGVRRSPPRVPGILRPGRPMADCPEWRARPRRRRIQAGFENSQQGAPWSPSACRQARRGRRVRPGRGRTGSLCPGRPRPRRAACRGRPSPGSAPGLTLTARNCRARARASQVRWARSKVALEHRDATQQSSTYSKAVPASASRPAPHLLDKPKPQA
jgi:hypothetical protein